MDLLPRLHRLLTLLSTLRKGKEMTKYESLEHKHGFPIGLSTDKGYVFWDNEKKCRVYEDPKIEPRSFVMPNHIVSFLDIVTKGCIIDTHEEGAEWNFSGRENKCTRLNHRK